jgi:hypothetical protein
LEQFDAAATLEQQPGTPQLRDSPAGGVSPRVRFRDDPLFVASGEAHPHHVSHALRGRAEGLRIQAELLEKEAHQHETRHKIASGQSCGQEAGSDIAAAWDKSVKAIEQVSRVCAALRRCRCGRGAARGHTRLRPIKNNCTLVLRSGAALTTRPLPRSSAAQRCRSASPRAAAPPRRRRGHAHPRRASQR